MIVQEEAPYTKEEVKAMVNTIHDLREKVSQLGWHPVSELPPEEGEYIVKKEWAPARADLSYSKFENGKWSTPQVKWWCYPPKEE